MFYAYNFIFPYHLDKIENQKICRRQDEFLINKNVHDSINKEKKQKNAFCENKKKKNW